MCACVLGVGRWASMRLGAVKHCPRPQGMRVNIAGALQLVKVLFRLVK